jgi:hypothetical protein
MMSERGRNVASALGGMLSTFAAGLFLPELHWLAVPCLISALLILVVVRVEGDR